MDGGHHASPCSSGWLSIAVVSKQYAFGGTGWLRMEVDVRARRAYPGIGLFHPMKLSRNTDKSVLHTGLLHSKQDLLASQNRPYLCKSRYLIEVQKNKPLYHNVNSIREPPYKDFDKSVNPIA
jgi:hypothetical protein